MPPSKSARSDALNAWIRALGNTGALAKNPSVTLPALIDELAGKYGERPALLSAGGALTYQALAERSNQYARWALANGLQPGEVVCLLMPNRPEYVACWLGITQVRGVVALINTNLTGDALAHSIGIVAPVHVIVDASLAHVVTQLPPGVRCWVHGDRPACGFPRIDLAIEQYAGAALDETERRPQSINERALHIYTSGTTGLPKAANISHFRLLEWSYWFAGMMDTKPSDRMYNCLPLYHSTGGVLAIGALLVNGGSVVIRPSFSASRFWDDVIANECTLFQYIGELCRYLVNTPSVPRETEHQLRLCCGNGLQPDIWETFRKRFNIPRILEFYASTEGNVSLYNCEGKAGAIGRVPPFLAHSFPVALIRSDAAGEPQRDAEGFCIRCETEEAGEAIGKIAGGDAPHMSQFEGYTDAGASDTKVLRNVFEADDVWYRTGDLMRKDAAGFFYFVDRVGDTFRWKGENVSTAQVAQTICACPGVRQAVVYGVAVPGTDGKAGMATMVVDQAFDLAAFRQHLTATLPGYARPLFVRIGASLEMTGTFKPTKGQLVRDGFNPVRTEDVIWFDDRTRGAFVPVDAELYAAILNARVRL
ncbi:MAG: long-chain-acyl-CoA synthetase [Acetobacteraceae bacterium]